MPKLSPTMEEGTIVAWHKKVGDFVEAGDLLFEVATDKATVEHSALDEGWLRKILVSENDEAQVNQAVAIFTEEETESIEGYEPEGLALATTQEQASEDKENAGDGAKDKVSPKPVPASGAMQQPAFEPPPPLEGESFGWERGDRERLRISPLAKKHAEEHGLDLRTLKGTGPGGRIVLRDLDRAPRAGGQLAPTGAPTLAAGSYEEEKLTPMRKAIARRLQEAKTFIPHFYVRQSVDAAPMLVAREQMKGIGQKVTFNDFITRACALALRQHPVINSGYNSVNGTITRYQTIDVAIAVAMDEGLITPILRHADYKSISELSAETRALAKRARSGELAPHEYQGGSFTISNLGMYGIDDFVAVINPPQACILAVGGILDQAVVKDEAVVPGKVLNLTLSSDHRVVDGATAAEFLRTLKGLLENPLALLV
jgi:pyruvate dehydrogenase E2 component (dihydrolipoamide acetyltransferase)